MYLSKVLIKGAACRNPYEIHKELWKLFSYDADADRDFLFRIEHAEHNAAEILMQSCRQPEQSYPTVRVLACKEYSFSLQRDQQLRFLLVANPVKTIKDENGRINAKGGPKSCRVPLVREEERHAWIARKFQGAAILETLFIDPVFPLRFRKDKEERTGKIQPVSFKGTLKVKEPMILHELIKKGIGPGKAFGCGLLSLARK
jgi:CRISPR system Cascade subunit CasE